MNFRGLALGLLGTVSALAWSGDSAAEGIDLSKLYVKGEGGYVFGGSADVDDPLFLGVDPVANPDAGIDLDFDSGFVFGGAVGYQILEQWRVELGATYEGRDLDAADSLLLLDSGDVDVLAVMASFYRDFSLKIGGDIIKPFIGGGIGVARLELDNLVPAFPNGPVPDEQDTNFAWTGTAGVGYQLTEQLALDFRYRYMDAGAFTVDTTFETSEGDYRSHAIMVGMRYFLGRAAPEPAAKAVPAAVAPPPPPPEPQVMTKVVYFDFDESAIRPEAASTLDDVATILGRNPEFQRVSIEAHADTKGPAGYNMRLSKRRAESVRSYLVDQRGIDGARVSIDWKGESNPVVATGDGVIEPQNRRAEVVIRIR